MTHKRDEKNTGGAMNDRDITHRAVRRMRDACARYHHWMDWSITEEQLDAEAQRLACIALLPIPEMGEEIKRSVDDTIFFQWLAHRVPTVESSHTQV